MSYSSTQVIVQKPCKASNLSSSSANSDDIISRIPFCGALIVGSTSIPGTNVETLVTFSSANYDTSSWFSGGSPTRLTVPTGYTRAQFSLFYNWSVVSASYLKGITMKKNGSTFRGSINELFKAQLGRGCASAIIQVTAGDYFQLYGFQNSGVSESLIGQLAVRAWK